MLHTFRAPGLLTNGGRRISFFGRRNLAPSRKIMRRRGLRKKPESFAFYCSFGVKSGRSPSDPKLQQNANARFLGRGGAKCCSYGPNRDKQKKAIRRPPFVRGPRSQKVCKNLWGMIERVYITSILTCKYIIC